MESPPSTSTWSDAFILSDDSGLLLTSGSISSGSMSGGFGHVHLEFQDSDCEDKSLSQADSLDGMSDIMCGEHFNTLKKGPHWSDVGCKTNSPIEPPLEFQDKPSYPLFDDFAANLALCLLREAIDVSFKRYMHKLKSTPVNIHIVRPFHQVISRNYWSPDFFPFSPCHSGRPSSRSSLGSSRLSSSHNSLSVTTAHKVDDSSFITQAVSHDTLSSNQISDLYNVPFDSDVYAIPVDTVKPPLYPKRNPVYRKRRRNTASGCREYEKQQLQHMQGKRTNIRMERISLSSNAISKRHSVACTSTTEGEPIHMTLLEVRQYLQTLYSSSSDSSENKHKIANKQLHCTNNNDKYSFDNNISSALVMFPNSNNTNKIKKNIFVVPKGKKIKDINKQQFVNLQKQEKKKKVAPRFSSLRQTLCNIFKFRKILSSEHKQDLPNVDEHKESDETECRKTYAHRALPPLPESENILDFATSIEKVKDYGWYWGPISSEAAEKILSNESDGSFLVRDSSDDHYIFSLTFKLNNTVRHVRIEHDQGNFSFGSCTKFKSQTIVEFIENAVEHSRSGRYLFFLHRRPTIGPVRVQLLHPVSRFKHTQSLQHLCRFVILKMVRKDLVPTLPLPRRMIDYLNTPHYYSEQLVDVDETENVINNNRDENSPSDISNPVPQENIFLSNNFSSENGRTNVPRTSSPINILRQS